VNLTSIFASHRPPHKAKEAEAILGKKVESDSRLNCSKLITEFKAKFKEQLIDWEDIAETEEDFPYFLEYVFCLH